MRHSSRTDEAINDPIDPLNVSLSVIVPTYREVENIPRLLEQLGKLRSNFKSFEVLIMDDNSQDGTRELFKTQEPWAKLHIRTQNRGLSPSVIEGFERATGDCIVVMDADLSHPPEVIPEMIENLIHTQAEVVVGSRYVKGGKVDEGWGVFRKLNSQAATFLARPLTTLKDPMSGFFAFRRSLLARAEGLNPIGYKILLELIVKARVKRVTEVPITFLDRVHGESKLSFKEQFKYLRHLKRLYDFKFGNFSYLLQFGVIGTAGIAVNLILLSIGMQLTSDLSVAVAFSILGSMIFNFLLNRWITFRGANRLDLITQFFQFMAACSVGAAVNYGVTLTLVEINETLRSVPQIAALVGILSGLVFNFVLSRYVVFKPEEGTETHSEATPKLSWKVAGLGVLILLVGRLAIFTEPFGISVDESTYLAMTEILHKGGVLYEDVVDRKPVGLFGLYYIIGKIFGPWNLGAVQGVFCILTFLLAWLAGRISYSLTRIPQAMTFGFLLYLLHSACFPRGIFSANAEVPMLISVVMASIPFLRTESVRFFGAFNSGIWLGLSFFFKQYSLLIFAPLMMMWFILRIREAPIARVQLGEVIFGLASGSLIVLGGVSLWFIVQGHGENFFRYTIFDGLNYVSTSRKDINHDTSAWMSLIGMLVSWPALWWLAGRALINEGRKKILIVGAGLMGALATAFLSGRYYTHYFIPVIWFLSVLAAVGFQIEGFRKRRWQTGALILSAFVFVSYAFFNLKQESFSSKWPFSKQVQSSMHEVCAYVQAHSSPKDRMVVWGMASQFYVICERGSGTRFVFADFVSGRLPGFKSSVSRPTPGAEDEYLSDLQAHRPKVFIDTSTAKLNDYGFFPLDRYPRILDFLREHYEKTASIQEFDIWMHRNP